MWTQPADHCWIDTVCRQLSRATGWPTTFSPCRAPDNDVLQAAGTHKSAAEGAPAEFAWVGELNSGTERVGRLSVVVPADRAIDAGFLRACESADLVTQLVQRVLIEQTRNSELRAATVALAAADHKTADTWTQAMQRVLDVALRLTGLRAAALFVLDAETKRLQVRAQRTCDRQTVMLFDRPLDQSQFDQQALRDGAVVVRRQKEEFSEWLPEGMSLGVCRGITTPQGVEGTLWCFDRRSRRLTVRESAVLDSLVVRLGELVDQAVLIRESALQRVLRAELRIAAESQPEREIRLDGLDGWCRIAGRTESAREVGGDLCEVLPLGKERLLVAIGDAAGHSIPAAMVMASVRGALRVMADAADADRIAPEQIVARLNRVLHGIVEAHQFMTLVCAIIDGRQQTLTLCSAGHPPALQIRNGVVQPLEVQGLLLGVVHDATYQSQTFDLQSGDLLVFYTDGISEAPSPQKSLFRAQGIGEAVFDHADQPPERIVEHVWAALEAHRTDDHIDDCSLLIASYRGTRCTIQDRYCNVV